jgi:hypothetical protein
MAMQEPAKIEKIKNHSIKVTKNQNYLETSNAIIPKSIKVFRLCKFNPEYNINSGILLSKNTVVFKKEKNNLLILNIKTGATKTIAIETNEQFRVQKLIPWGENSIISIDQKGNIKMCDVTKELEKGCKMVIQHIVGSLDILVTLADIGNSILAVLIQDKFAKNIHTLKFFNVENSKKPILIAEKKLYTDCHTIKSIGNDQIICFGKGEKGYVFDTKNLTQDPAEISTLHPSLARIPMRIERFFKTSFNKTTGGKNIEYNTKYHIASKEVFLRYFIQNLFFLPNNSFACVGDKTITFLNSKTITWTHQIDIQKFVENFIIFSSCIHNKIILITDKGYLITCECAEGTKDLHYLFKNLKISETKKNFKDCMITFK